MKIGEALLKHGLINTQQLQSAIEEQAKISDRLGDIIIKKGYVSIEEMATFLAGFFDLTYVKLKDLHREIKPEIIKLVPENLARRFTIIPIALENSSLTIAMADPLDFLAVDTLQMKTGLKIRRVVSSTNDIIAAISYCYHQDSRMKDSIDDFIALESGPDTILEDYEKLRSEAADPPVVQYVNSLIIKAINNNASDIHLVPKQDSVELYLRIDGILHKLDSPPKRMLAAIITRIKILSNLDIAERRLPQDGRFRLKVGASEVDARVSSFPAIYGENLVMRIFNTSSSLIKLEQLGFSDDELAKFKGLISHAYGLILITGPTGSGKTTTLYAALNEIKSAEKNMVTLEDPVEHRLPFLRQSQVNPVIGFDFARGLRSLVRQDPDVIMVGEIRDRETAEVAIHSALTGHLVFSTLHTNDASSAAVRLINMGIEPFLITSSLLGVLAQRLVRCICKSCRAKYAVKKDILEHLGLAKEAVNFYKGAGCAKCLNSGYKGRSGIFELLVLDEPLRNLIISRASGEDIKRLACERGMRTLRDSSIEKLKSGISTPEEVFRMTQLTKWD